MVTYVRVARNPDGSRMSYAQRSAERKRQDAERRAKQNKQHVAPRPSFYDLPYHERERLRRIEEQGRREGERLAAIEERARRQAEIDATPEHLRRPENVWTALIAEWESQSYDPSIARKLRDYREREAEREKEIDAEMQDKLRQFNVENNPETQGALGHWERAVAGAETDDEQCEFARLRGIIEAGAAERYWDAVAPLMEARLTRIRERMAEQATRQAPLADEAAALAESEREAEELRVGQEPDASEEPAE